MKSKFVLFVGLIILGLKLLIIDIDIPNKEVAHYQPIDEVYYAQLAYNYYEQGEFFVDEPTIFGTPIITNIVTYFSLVVFGDNYLGLRFSSLFFSVISFIVFFLLLKKLIDNTKLQFAAVLFFTINFSFTTSNIVVEPTIARMATALISLLLVLKWRNNENSKTINIIWQSALIGLLFLFSYPTNAFVILAAYIALILVPQSHMEHFLKMKYINFILVKSTYYFIGILIALLIYYGFSLLLGADLLEGIILRGNTYDNRVGLNFRGIILNIISIIKANIFIFNPLVFIMIVPIVLNMVLFRYRKLNNTVIVIGIFLASFLLQTVFINDYPQRKLIILLPFIILIAVDQIHFMIESKRQTPHSLLIFNIITIFAVGIVLLYLDKVNEVIHVLPWLTSILAILLLLLNSLFRIKLKMLPYIFFILLILPETYYLSKYYLVNQTYNYKQTFINLSEYDGHHFIGGFSMGCRVYNDIIPSLNQFLYEGRMDTYWHKIDNLSKNGLIDYSIGYKMHEEDFERIGYRPIKIVMNGEQSIDGRDWILYKEIEIK